MDDKGVFKAIEMFIKTNRMHKKLIDFGVQSSINIHRTQHIILMHLAKCNTLLSQKELAEHLNITPAAVTGALKKLECDGYIRRSVGGDNRYNEITITEQGRRVVEESRALFQRIDRSLFVGFSDEEIRTFTDFLERMQNNMRME